MKGCEVISEWSEPIRNHFWYIAQECKGDEEKLKVSSTSTVLLCRFCDWLYSTMKHNGLYIE